MIVKDLIKLLLDMPQDAPVVIDIDPDIRKTTYVDMTHVTKHVNYEGSPLVVLDADWGNARLVGVLSTTALSFNTTGQGGTP